jgi:uncharacterized protein YcaQ
VARLTAAQARTLHLHAQGLRAQPTAPAVRGDVVAAVARMALLQIDTIHVVARSPYLVLFSRLGDYDARWLDEALAAGELFETWAHEACFAPMADWGLLRRRNLHSTHWAHRHAQRTRDAHAGGMAALLEHVRAHGEVRTADFAGTGTGAGGWWGWKDEKRFLEAWFALGELMIARRERFQRVYDLSERVLARAAVPPGAVPAEAEAVRTMRLQAIRALGVAQARWVSDYYRLGPRVRDAELEPLADSGEILAVEVAGWDAPGWVHRDHAEALDQVAQGRLRATHGTLLSPFDPVVWHRERASMLMGFDYTLECYTPAPKRAYGYFVLPILVGNRLVGRLDAKAWRAERTFEVKALYLEDDVAPTSALLARVARAIVAAARWHGTPKVKLGKCSPRAVAVPLRAAIRSVA